MSYTLVDDEPGQSFTLVDDAPAARESSRKAGAAAAKSQPIKAGILSAAQGPFFNFADNIAAGGASLVDKVTGRNPGFTLPQLYDRYLGVARGAQTQFADDNPVLAPTLQVGAALASGVGLARAAPAVLPSVASIIGPTSTMGRVGTAALAGAGSGAISGAGNAEGFDDMPGEAGQGALFGALTGGILNAAGQGGGAVTRNIAARSGNSKIVQDRIREGGFGSSMAQRVDTTANDLAKQRLATALARDGRSTGQTSARLRTLGDDASLAVAGGKNTVDLLDTMATMPGRTADDVERAIRAQQIGRPGRIEAGANGLAGGRQFDVEIGALTKRQQDDAGPLYDAIRGIPVAADGKLQTILNRPVIQEALGQARVSAANADSVLPDIKAGEAVPMAVWDQIKRGLDDVIGAKKRGLDVGTANNAAKSTLGDAVRTKQELLSVLDDLVPGYKQARDAFAGPAALKDAMEEGRSLFATKPIDLKQALAGMTASEQDAFRVGAAQALREKIGTESGQTAVLKFWKEPATRERLQAIFPNTRTYREFQSALLAEGRLKTLEGVGRGSQTAARQARMDDEGTAAITDAMGGLASLKTGNPLGIVQGVRNLYGRTVMPEPVRDRIGQMLLKQGPEAQSLLGDLSRYVEAENARRAASAGRSGLLGGVGINSLLGN